MKKLTQKRQEKVLRRIIKMIDSQDSDCLVQPKGFEKAFSFLSPPELDRVLRILRDKGLISITYADFPDSFNIYTLSVTPKGFDFFPQKSLTTQEKWKERIIGFVFGVATSVLGGIILEFVLK